MQVAPMRRPASHPQEVACGWLAGLRLAYGAAALRRYVRVYRCDLYQGETKTCILLYFA
jgi:hypothetical protein